MTTESNENWSFQKSNFLFTAQMKSNKEIVAEFINATNQKNWDKVISLVHEDFIRHSSSEPKEVKTSIGLVNFHKAELEVFPDLQEIIIFAIEEGDLVAARINFSGTQLGQLINFPPTGKKLTSDFNCFFRVIEEKIKETWVEYDNLNGLIQLGHYK
ncbi:ester cyclase [Hymenobacter sp.]|uniref:ester cyclase n=1 Tax=Hymenobacter sp. TaxID=1898978 RepID=UPI00286BADB1|nr:ester cyclase [Hymenobacter sp.]